MKVVPSLPFGVRGCTVLHGRTADPEGFVELPRCRGCGMSQYASAEAVKIMGNEFGMVPKDRAIESRFEINQLERDLTDAREQVAGYQALEDEFVKARETIAEYEDIRDTLSALSEQGLTTKQVRGVLDRVGRIKDDLDAYEGTVSDLLDLVNRIAALSKEKVPA